MSSNNILRERVRERVYVHFKLIANNDEAPILHAQSMYTKNCKVYYNVTNVLEGQGIMIQSYPLCE